MLAVVVIIPAVMQAASGREGAPFIPKSQSPTIASLLQQVQADNFLLAQAPPNDDKPPSFDIRSGKKTEKAAATSGKKSAVKAFILSALVPGAGQLYTGSKFKAAVFFGLEVLAWTGNRYYHNRGDHKTQDFNNWADAYWSITRYRHYLDENLPTANTDTTLTGNEDSLGFGHHLPGTKTQQYYEMVGKYNQFVFGWDDVDTTKTPYKPSSNRDQAYSWHRLHYEDMRHFANSQYSYAKAFLVAAMINHLVAGAEAALAATRHNRRLDDLADHVMINAVAVRSDNGYFPMLTMTCRF